VFELLYGLPLLVKAAILGVVEGLTEFLPISSTGHLILAGSLLGFSGEKAKMFDVAIQTGAMLSVIWYYRRKILHVIGGLTREASARRFALNVVVGFLPAALLGCCSASTSRRFCSIRCRWRWRSSSAASSSSGWSGARRPRGRRA